MFKATQTPTEEFTQNSSPPSVGLYIIDSKEFKFSSFSVLRAIYYGTHCSLFFISKLQASPESPIITANTTFEEYTSRPTVMASKMSSPPTISLNTIHLHFLRLLLFRMITIICYTYYLELLPMQSDPTTIQPSPIKATPNQTSWNLTQELSYDNDSSQPTNRLYHIISLCLSGLICLHLWALVVLVVNFHWRYVARGGR